MILHEIIVFSHLIIWYQLFPWGKVCYGPCNRFPLCFSYEASLNLHLLLEFSPFSLIFLQRFFLPSCKKSSDFSSLLRFDLPQSVFLVLFVFVHAFYLCHCCIFIFSILFSWLVTIISNNIPILNLLTLFTLVKDLIMLLFLWNSMAPTTPHGIVLCNAL